MKRHLNSTFAQIVERAQSAHGDVSRQIIEKELLHYDILYCMEEEGLLDNLVFQGGTSLRLCHGSDRYSEDLDFSGGKGFSIDSFDGFKARIENRIARRYNLRSRVKVHSRPLRHGIDVARWWVNVETRPEKRDLPFVRIRIEVANVAAKTATTLPLRMNYDVLPENYRDIYMRVSTLDELLADKLIAFASAKAVRYRDMFDIGWLDSKGAVFDQTIFEQKVNDYAKQLNWESDYFKRTQQLEAGLSDLVESEAFRTRVGAFLSLDRYQATLGNVRYREFLCELLTSTYRQVQDVMKRRASAACGH